MKPDKKTKSAFIGLKIEPEIQDAYRKLPIESRKQIASAMRAIVKDAVSHLFTADNKSFAKKNKS